MADGAPGADVPKGMANPTGCRVFGVRGGFLTRPGAGEAVIMDDIDSVLRRELSVAQYNAAVDMTDRVLTLACAGSGKSRTLAYRIAFLIAEGADPKGIVAFTFTVKAADSIRRNVARALAAAGMDERIIGSMYIGTVHAYCRHVLEKMDARYRQFDPNPRLRTKSRGARPAAGTACEI